MTNFACYKRYKCQILFLLLVLSMHYFLRHLRALNLHILLWTFSIACWPFVCTYVQSIIHDNPMPFISIYLEKSKSDMYKNWRVNVCNMTKDTHMERLLSLYVLNHPPPPRLIHSCCLTCLIDKRQLMHQQLLRPCGLLGMREWGHCRYLYSLNMMILQMIIFVPSFLNGSNLCSWFPWQRLAEDSNPAVAVAASKAIYELKKQWEIEEGDSWRFMMNLKPAEEADSEESSDDADTN